MCWGEIGFQLRCDGYPAFCSRRLHSVSMPGSWICRRACSFCKRDDRAQSTCAEGREFRSIELIAADKRSRHRELLNSVLLSGLFDERRCISSLLFCRALEYSYEAMAAGSMAPGFKTPGSRVLNAVTVSFCDGVCEVQCQRVRRSGRAKVQRDRGGPI